MALRIWLDKLYYDDDEEFTNCEICEEKYIVEEMESEEKNDIKKTHRP